MINRPFSTVLARLGLVAAILATLMILAPVALAADAEYDYAEDREDAVATFSAADPDADAGDIEWDVSGVDAEFFTIDDGVLSWKEQPDFETAEDNDEDTTAAGPQGEGDNVYQVTVVASDGELDVAVTVTDVDEPGKVTFTQPQPQATRSLEAKGPGDPDNGVDEISWQWSRCTTQDNVDDCTPIPGAKSAKRTPTTDDIDHYLRATVTYVDVHGDQSESGVTDNKVEPRTLANAAPEFDEDEIKPIEHAENKAGKVGEPIVATDKDSDELLYDVDTESATGALNDNTLFKVDNNGQLSLKAEKGLDFEADPSTSTTDDASTTDIIEYTVVLRATDPSGADDTVTVMVHLTNVNEAPEFAKDATTGKFLQTTLYIAEDGATAAEGPGIFTDDDLAGGNEVATYSATDEDTLDDTVAFTLEGADKDDFSLTTAGVLTTRQADTTATPPVVGLKANFEDKSSYSIIIVAGGSDADDDDRGTKYTRLEVTVKVVDREDTGKVKLSARQSQVNIPVVATHSDEDGGVTDGKWQWYRGSTLPTDLSTLLDADGNLLAAGTIACVDDDPDIAGDLERTAADTLCRIDGETAALYTPDSNDVDRLLHVVADYKDDFSPTVREQAGISSGATVQASNPANTAPEFPDQDLSTPEMDSVAMRSVDENADKGTKVGEPIPAGDADKGTPEGNMELLTYTIDDTDNFSVDQEGQISTAVKLDFEMQSMYTVMLTATDPSGASATITVMISVNDKDDPAVITADAEYDYAEDREDAVATFSAADPDADAGDIEWDVSGVDAEFFTIDDGVLSWKEQPDFETAEDNDEDTTAAGPQGEGDNVYQVTVVASDGELDVAVTVTDVDEPGKVTFTQPQPQATRSLEAKGPGDPDNGVDEISWQWSRCTTQDNVDDCTPIPGAKSAKRTPTTDDIDHYLRATVTYVDVHGDQSESGVTDNKVEPRTLANAAPEFDEDEIKPIEHAENKAGKVGEPIVATDKDSDELLYDVDTESATGALNDNTLFKVDNNGQLSLKAEKGLDFEADPSTSTTDDASTTDIIEYTVVLRATDPSGADDTVTVMVHLTNVNEAPEFAKDATTGKFLQTTLYIAEDGATAAEGPGIFTDDDLAGGNEVATYSATDEDTLDDTVAFTLEGADKDDFSLTTAGVLTTRQADTTATPPVVGLKANFEDKSSYSIIIVAGGSDADDDDRGTKYTRLEVTVKVVDREDTGKVKLSARQSQVNIPVVATHSDEDGGVTDRKWQWYRGSTLPTDLSTLLDADGNLLAAGTIACVDDDPDIAGDLERTAADTLCRIDGETAALYTPDSNDVDRLLHVVADYKDDFSPTVREQAGISSGATVQASNPANTAPEFPDQDLSTPEMDSVAMRSVDENADKGTKVGEPIPAGDADKGTPEGNMELLTYTIDDTDNFSVDQEGQISTAVKLDFEMQSMYTVMLTATDPSGASATITVMISVNDKDDAAVITPNRSPVFDDGETAERMVAENSEAGTPVGDPVAATDADDNDLTYELSGDDAMYFAIDDSGQITVGEGTMLDYESKMMYMVTVTADDGTASHNARTSIAVTIMVIDNAAPAFASDTTTEMMVDENQDAGTAVGSVTATDAEGDAFTYMDDSTYFDVDDMGNITTTMMLDHEAMASHTVTVTASNGEGEGSIEVTIAVVDNAGPAFASETAERSVDEGRPAGLNVGDPITATDAEGDAITYSVTSEYFEIDGDGQITTTMSLDYDAMPSHTVTVMASNGEGEATVEVTIMVIENTPPAFGADTATRSVGENMYAGAAVGDPVTAMDDDTGDSVTYSLSGSMYFEIDGDGQITTTMMLDYEAMTSHMVTVTATDVVGDTDSVDVTINVDNAHTGCDTAGSMGLVNDCEALLDSKEALGGSLNWTDHTHTPMSDWTGVTMSDGRVTAIDLRDQGLDGTISSALGRVSMLTSLNLRSNAELSGEIPGSLNNLSNLTILNLHSNSHTGEIPDLSGTSLTQLYLTNNDLTGGVPGWLNGMTDMTQLWLTGNMLSGAMPDLSGMTSLEILKVNGNAVSGLDAAMLPNSLRWLIAGQTDVGATAPDLSSLTNLTTLWLNETGLTGQIPVASLPASLTSLNLKDNMLSGTIPDMSGLDNLRLLRLHRNQLSGDIPGTMGDMESIERIWLHENELTGIAAGLANAADTLTHLYLDGNSFAEGTCLAGGLADVANNDFEAAGLEACSQ